MAHRSSLLYIENVENVQATLPAFAIFDDYRPTVTIAELKPDVVLMEGGNGIDACREIKDLLPETRVLMLTSRSAAQAVDAAVLAGASGYLLKDGGRQELLEGIRAVAMGESLLSPAVTSEVIKRMVDLTSGRAAGITTKEPSREPDPLSVREQEVLTLVAQGLTNREIAVRLVISSNTVRNHVSHIMDKLDMTRRSQAAVYAARHGMLETDADASPGLDAAGLDASGSYGGFQA